MSITIPEPLFTITTDSNYCRMAEATIHFMGTPIGYVGGSSSEQTCRDAAEEVLEDVFRPIIDAIKDHPEVDRVSRFDTDYDEDPFA